MKSLPDLLYQSLLLSREIEQSDDVIPHELALLQEETELAIKQKVDSYAALIEHFEREELKWKEQQELCNLQRNKAKKLQERMRDRLKDFMTMTKRNELPGHLFRFLLTPMKPKLILDVEKLPKDCMMPITTYVPDKELIRHRLEMGEIIEGARLEPVNAMRRYP